MVAHDWRGWVTTRECEPASTAWVPLVEIPTDEE
jgi:hypothetical protein